MPLINVTSTKNPQSSVTSTTQFNSTDSVMSFVSNSPNLPSPIETESTLIQPVVKPDPQVQNFQQVKEYSNPIPAEIVNQNVDIKQSLDSKLESSLSSLSQQLEPVVPQHPLPVNSSETNMQQVVSPQVPMPVSVEQLISQQATPVFNNKEQTPNAEVLPTSSMVGNTGIEINSTSNFKEQLDSILQIAINKNASDVHLTTGYKILIRVDGKLQSISADTLTEESLESFVDVLLEGRTNIDKSVIKEYDMTYTANSRRFRVNIFRQMGKFSMALRVIPERIKSIQELDLPSIISQFPGFPNGLVLVTGPTGSGKSTTIAAILNQINLTLPKHIVTLEDPIEFVFPKGTSLVDQREFGLDFSSWDNALRAVLRQDPDVVLVGEMRDLETVEAALQIAETGHLVFATVHTNGAAETINRVVDVFESQKQDQIRVQLASVLRAVISQKLVPLPNGGRKAIIEVMIATPSIKSAIRDKKTFQIDNIIKTSADVGMIPMEKSIIELVKKGLITREVAKSLSNNPNEIDILLNS